MLVDPWRERGREREREGEREGEYVCVCVCVHMYVYVLRQADPWSLEVLLSACVIECDQLQAPTMSRQKRSD
jgi:hypothetical protein